METSNISSEWKPSLIAIGGRLEFKLNNPIVREFLKFAGGTESKITILPTASTRGKELGPQYVSLFGQVSKDVEFHIIDKRIDAQKDEIIERIQNSTGIYFTGGNQAKITSLLGGTELMSVLKEKNKKGLIIAGTSAGASAMSATMIAGGRADIMNKGSFRLSPGLGLIPDMVIDSHFIKRGRISRLLHVVAENPGTIGLGLTENTCIFYYPEYCILEVIGESQVVVVDGRDIEYSNIAVIKEGKPYSITNVKLHVLTHGFGYNCRSHEVLFPSKVHNQNSKLEMDSDFLHDFEESM